MQRTIFVFLSVALGISTHSTNSAPRNFVDMPSTLLQFFIFAIGLYLAFGDESPQHLTEMEYNCPAGSGWATYGCKQCQSGQYSSQNRCKPCGPGTSAAAYGSTVCTTCYPGFFALGGATTCKACPSGTHSTYGAPVCIICPMGTSAGPNAAAQCERCSPGSYSNTVGSETCKKCPAGTSSYLGASGCDNCLLGEYSLAGQVCKDCPAGSFAAVVGSTQCTKCTAPAGSQKGAYRCNTCKAGSIALGIGSAPLCYLCSKGTYSAAKFAVSCTSCPSSQTTAGAGATKCKPK